MANAASITALAEKVITRGHADGKMLASAESCTGGLIGAALTDISGASAVFDRGFITYTNEAKAELLAVPVTLIEEHGAVSAPVALAMAHGAVAASNADVAVSVTGIAGPTGGTTDKPVGLVYFGLASKQDSAIIAHTERRLFPKGARDFIRTRSVETALRLLLQGLGE